MAEHTKSGYELTRAWFDFAFENPGLVNPTHGIMYLWFVELNNRMGWADKFFSPASQTMAAIGLKSYNTYKKIFDDLVEFGFVKVVSESKNQYTACIIALLKFDKAHNKALDKAMMKHMTTQGESTLQSTSESNDSINKQLNNKTNKLKTIKPIKDNTTQLEIFEEIVKKSFDETGCVFGNEFKKVWLTLIQQPKWRKKNQTAINAALSELNKYNEHFSISQVNQAIAGNWQGVTFANTDEDYRKWKAAKYGNSNPNGLRPTSRQPFDYRKNWEDRKDLDDAAKQLIAEKLKNGYGKL